jgi:CRISPR-associated protein Cas1
MPSPCSTNDGFINPEWVTSNERRIKGFCEAFSVNNPWLAVTGFGAHIKATPTKLIIQRKGDQEEYPIGSIRHLLLVGGHTLHTAAIMALIRAGTTISFFEADGMPVAFMRPYGDRSIEDIRAIQEHAPAHTYAVEIAKASIRSRMLLAESMGAEIGEEILYEGELQIIHKALEEIDFLIKLDEIRRLDRLVADMYYEIMARTIPPEIGFRRRTQRPYHDAVNAMLSFGYAMLVGNCYIAVTAASLDPDIGMLSQGERGLLYDLVEPFKTTMIDRSVFSFARQSFTEDDYDCTGGRCILSDDLIRSLIKLFRESIRQDQLEEQALVLRNSLLHTHPFYVLHQLSPEIR